MCNGHSIRESQGGSIAVLRPTRHLLRNRQQEEDMLLFFNNQFSNPGTSIDFQGLDEGFQQSSYWIVIHRDGDLSGSQAIQTDPLYSFALEERPGTTMQLSQKLHLGVGDKGIVGRRVSVITGTLHEPRALAEGIIGWN